MGRYIFTGAPGAGKTALLEALGGVGYPVVREAATDVIAQQMANGVPEPWTDSNFLSDVVHLQIVRQSQADSARVVLFDRSPICTLALASYSDRPVPVDVSAEVDRLVREGFYEPNVFLVRPLGFIERTAARRITYEDSLLFEAIHESTYTSLGFNLVDVPPTSLDSRVATVKDTIDRYEAGRT